MMGDLAYTPLITEEIEDPLGGHYNNLHMAKLTENIHHNVDAIRS